MTDTYTIEQIEAARQRAARKQLICRDRKKLLHPQQQSEQEWAAFMEELQKPKCEPAMTDFDGWYKSKVKQTIGKVAAKAAWDYQQSRVEELQDENRELDLILDILRLLILRKNKDD